jgi:hypothetical protein
MENSHENFGSEFDVTLKQAISEIKSSNGFVTTAGQEILLRDISEKYSTAGLDEQNEVLNDLKNLDSDEIFEKYSIDRSTIDEKIVSDMNTVILRASEIIRAKARTNSNSRITDAGIDHILEKIKDDLVTDPEETLISLEAMSPEDFNKKFLS